MKCQYKKDLSPPFSVIREGDIMVVVRHPALPKGAFVRVESWQLFGASVLVSTLPPGKVPLYSPVRMPRHLFGLHLADIKGLRFPVLVKCAENEYSYESLYE